MLLVYRAWGSYVTHAVGANVWTLCIMAISSPGLHEEYVQVTTTPCAGNAVFACLGYAGAEEIPRMSPSAVPMRFTGDLPSVMR